MCYYPVKYKNYIIDIQINFTFITPNSYTHSFWPTKQCVNAIAFLHKYIIV